MPCLKLVSQALSGRMGAMGSGLLRLPEEGSALQSWCFVVLQQLVPRAVWHKRLSE